MNTRERRAGALPPGAGATSYISQRSIVLVPRTVSPWWLGGTALGCIVATLGLGCAGRPPGPSAERPGLPRIEAQPMAELARFAGSEACASCHPNESRAHAASEHARAMSRVTAATHGVYFRRPSSVVDPDQKTVYRTAVRGDRCVLQAVSGGSVVEADAEYGFGSAKHSITYTGRQGSNDLELRLSYYSGPRRWGFSPGQQLGAKSGGVIMPTGLIKPAETVEGCFVCHSTVIGKEGGTLRPETCRMGVGCESCHGPARDHIEAVRRGDRKPHLADLKSLSGADLTQQLCGQCHRSPAGEDLNDSFNRSQLPRLQGLALSQSPCFTNSGGRLSCITCHDPHDQTPRPVSFYNAKCVSCHGGASLDQPACRVEPQGNCVSCHMPAQKVRMPFGLSYRTHWIKVWDGR